eukprot:197095_1
MEPLIRLRLLAAQLKQHELQHLIQSVIESYTADQILSFIFNHFVLRYQQTKEVDSDATQMIQMISDVLNTRKKTQSKANQKRTVSATIKIDSIPSDMIGECASFLQVIDYISFSKCNRKTYIGCNSPATLQMFDLTNKSIECNMNRFPLLKKLTLSNQAVQRYIELNPNQKTSDNVHSLRLFTDDKPLEPFDPHFDIALLSKFVQVQNIRQLACSCFGFEHENFLCDCQSFCDLLSNFKQVNALFLHRVFLTDDVDIDAISNILPKLRSLQIRNHVNQSTRLLRNKLLEMYSQQMETISCDESKMDIGVSCFPKLKYIMITHPNIDSLFKIVDSAPYLEHFTCEIPISQQRVSEKKIKKVIDTLFFKCIQLQEVGIRANHMQIQSIMECMTLALCINTITKHVHLGFVILSQTNTEENNQIMVLLSKLIDVLESKMNDFMVTIHFSSQSPKPFEQNMDKYEEQYLVWIFNDFHSMVISNKTCKINGYLPKAFL